MTTPRAMRQPPPEPSLLEQAARSILERRTRPDWGAVDEDGRWRVDHDLELARAAAGVLRPELVGGDR